MLNLLSTNSKKYPFKFTNYLLSLISFSKIYSYILKFDYSSLNAYNIYNILAFKFVK